jgi:hypothetical protein
MHVSIQPIKQGHLLFKQAQIEVLPITFASSDGTPSMAS